MDEQRLKDIVKDKIGDAAFVVASNREPYVHVRSEEGVKCIRPASGMATAIDSVMAACGGTWVAHGGGNADKEHAEDDDGLGVPVDDPKYRLRRVWMSRDEEEGYYNIVSNTMFWPLCHTVYVRPVFDEEAWKQYREINERFAGAILEEIGDRQAFVWLQDYHLSLVPPILKKARSDLVTAHFWHIPWPQNETFRACPWKKEVLEGLLANDLIGFHSRSHCNNFLETVDRNIEAKTDRAEYSVSYQDRKTYVHPFPISVDFAKISRLSDQSVTDGRVERLRKKYQLSGKMVGLGVERIDYTKGIPEKLRALSSLLERKPRYRGKIVYIQIGSPSRLRLEHYREINDEIEDLVEEINWQYGSDEWTPVIYLNRHHEFEDIVAFYRLANLCIVSSLHDGMNLVAKEFISANPEMGRMLILSEFTGASEELGDALIVNPYDTKQFVATLEQLSKMDDEEKTRRMQRMREHVREFDIYKWTGDIVSSISKLSPEP